MDTIDDDPGRRVLTRKEAILGGGAVAISLAGLVSGCGSSSGRASTAAKTSAAGTGGPGLALTKLSQLQPFQFSNASGPKPNLPKRFSYANVNTSDIYVLFGQGIQKACTDRGLAFDEANAQTNVATNVQQIQAFLERGTGALDLIPLGANTQNVVARQAIREGIAVFNNSGGPSTCQLDADQATVGHAHGTAAADWIRQNLGGKATVAYFNLNAIAPVLVARTNAALAALGAVPGIKIINIGVGQSTFSPQGGFQMTSSLLQAHPDVNVIMSADTFIEGAVKAVKTAGNTTVKYISGVDGEAPVLAQIGAGNSLIKATFGFAWPLLGYATGQFAADWLDGKTIPQAVIVNPIELNSAAAIGMFNAKNGDPAAYWKAETAYLDFLGAISYATRHNWLQNALT